MRVFWGKTAGADATHHCVCISIKGEEEGPDLKEHLVAISGRSTKSPPPPLSICRTPQLQ